MAALAGCGGIDKSTTYDDRTARGTTTPSDSATPSGSATPSDSATPSGSTTPSVTQPSPATERTYLLTISQSNWSAPQGIGYDLFGIFPALILKTNGSSVAVATAAGTESDAEGNLSVVTASEATQDLCTPTSQLPVTQRGLTLFGPASMRWHLTNGPGDASVQVTQNVYDLELEDVLPSDGMTSTSGALNVTLDFRQFYLLAAALGPTRTPDSMCAAFAAEYTSSDCLSDSCVVACEACPTDGAPYCLTVHATGIGAIEAPNLPFTEIDEASRPASCADSNL
jgi:hypothetical protein